MTDAGPPAKRDRIIDHEGSAFDAERERRTPRTLRRRIRNALSWYAIGFVAFVWPWLYVAYCWFVYATSRLPIDEITPKLTAARKRHGRVIALLWHQEVFTVAWAYRHLRGHTLASVGNFGRIITRMLERCNFVVFRGGSSMGTARRRRVLPLMIRHMREETDLIYGITVDGSNGPIYQLKGGMLAVARACRAPIFVVRTWYSRRLELRTWDRTGVPLPFSRLYSLCLGPYWLEPDATPERVEELRKHLELELLDLCHESYKLTDGPGAPVPAGFPAGWTPRWTNGVRGIPFGPHDLKPDEPPAWASVPGVQQEHGAAADEETGEDDPPTAGGVS